MSENTAMSEVFLLLADLAAAHGTPCIKDTVWLCRIDDHWTVAINGHKTRKKVTMPESECEQEIEPFTAFIEFNGWPAGVISPQGGCIAAGAAANEDTFCEAIKSAILAARKKGSE